MLIKKLVNWWRNRHCMFVIADCTDNSITLSKSLFEAMGGTDIETPKVFVFYAPSLSLYGFMLNPSLDKPTQLADIQYNTTHKCVGFESLNPTVNRIFYDYSIKTHVCRLKVRRRITGAGDVFFTIER